MDRGNITEAVQEIFRDAFDDGQLSISDETNADDIEDWDSLAQISLVSAIEQEFAVRFALGELATLRNVGDMIELICRKSGGS
jgi:acyl carrier protein